MTRKISRKSTMKKKIKKQKRNNKKNKTRVSRKKYQKAGGWGASALYGTDDEF